MSDYPHTASIKSKTRRSGLFQRALVGEFVSNGLLVFSALFGIVVVSQLIRLLGSAVGGEIAVDGVLALLGFGAMSYLPVLISVSMFISILLAISRCYRDSEMVVWFGSGIGLTYWIRPVLSFVLPVVAVIALLSLVLSPWSLRKAEEFKNKLESRDDVATATTGIFRESKRDERVYFIENVDVDSNRVGNIFVKSMQNEKMATMVAREGYQETLANGDRFLVLLNGMRYEGTPGQRDYNIIEFERYAMRIDALPATQVEPERRSMTTMELWLSGTPWHIAELQWRLGLPISAAIIALMAIPLSHVNPRAGRSLNLVLAIVLYMLYSNMISVTNAWVGHEKISPVIGLFGVHLVMLVFAGLMFYRRMTLFPLRRWLDSMRSGMGMADDGQLQAPKKVGKRV